jgi:hypothetical protein
MILKSNSSSIVIRKRVILYSLIFIALEAVYNTLKENLDETKKKGKSKFKQLFTKKSKNKSIPFAIKPIVEKQRSLYTPADDPAFSVKHKSTKFDDVSIKSDEGNLSDKEGKSKSKFKFGFGRLKKRSSSTVKSKSLKKQQIMQMEEDLQAIESKIGNSENLKNMIQQDFQDRRERFREAYVQLEELKKFKEEIKNQM